MSIHKKILEIRQEVDSIPKNGWNDFHKYAYAEANDVIDEVRPVFNDKKVVIYPIGTEDITINVKDGGGFVERWTQVYLLLDTEDDSSMKVRVRCAGEDKGDKSAYKGNTGALKYLFIDLLLLDTDDDPERTPKSGQSNKPKKDNREWLNKTHKESDDITKKWKNATKAIRAGKYTAKQIIGSYRMKDELKKELKAIEKQST